MIFTCNIIIHKIYNIIKYHKLGHMQQVIQRLLWTHIIMIVLMVNNQPSI